MKNNFIRCGLLGLCIEVFFTGLSSALQHDYRLTGHSSILMFPIYGAAAVIKPVSKLLQKKNALFRGIVYMFGIYFAEFTSGTVLRKKGICPWDYSKEHGNIRGLIRLDYAPLWLLTGLLFEKVVTAET